MKYLLLTFAIISSLSFGARPGGRKLVVTGLAGIPHPVNFGIDYKLTPKFSLGVTGGLISLNLKWSTGDQFKIGTQNIEGRMRFHPFGGVFFFGLAGGTQTVTGETSRSITASGITVDVTASGNISNTYLIPHLGWLYVAGSGFTLGFELGAYLPFNPNTTTSLSSTNPLFSLVTSTAEFQSLQSDIGKFGNDLGSKQLPFLTLLRIGWAF